MSNFLLKSVPLLFVLLFAKDTHAGIQCDCTCDGLPIDADAGSGGVQPYGGGGGGGDPESRGKGDYSILADISDDQRKAAYKRCGDKCDQLFNNTFQRCVRENGYSGYTSAMFIHCGRQCDAKNNMFIDCLGGFVG